MYESRYTDKVAYENYLLDLELQQAEMTRYVNECVILSGPDKRKAIEEMAIFNEGALGDKFKKVWARIKSFFAKIYQKFLESLQAWAGDNIAYLKQYSNVIFEKKCTLKTVKMQDHFAGMKIFNDKFTPNAKPLFAQIPKMDNLKDIEDQLTGLADTKPGDKLGEKGQDLVDKFTVAQQIQIADTLGAKNLVDASDTSGFAGRLRNFLNGGEEINEYSGSELEGDKMEIMYNFLYKYDATVESLKKIKDAFDTGMSGIETAYKKGFDSMKSSIKNVESSDVKNALDTAKGDSDPGSGTLAAELKDAKKDAEATPEAQNSAYSYVYGTVITEADIDAGSGGGNKNDGKIVAGDSNYSGKSNKGLEDSNKATRKTGTQDASDVKKDANFAKSNTAAGQSKMTAAELKSKGASNEDLEKYEDYALSMVRAWGNVRSVAMGAALNMLSDTRRDYFDVIRAHVRSWVGQTTAPDQNTDTKPTNNTKTA